MNIDVQDAAQKANCTALAADLVLSGLAFAVAKKRAEGLPSAHVSASELCDAIAETAKANHGRSLRATFTKAGILGSEDVGRIVFSLADHGLLVKRDGDLIEEFDGLFETARLE